MAGVPRRLSSISSGTERSLTLAGRDTFLFPTWATRAVIPPYLKAPTFGSNPANPLEPCRRRGSLALVMRVTAPPPHLRDSARIHQWIGVGDVGTGIFVLVGLIFVALAAGLFWFRRRFAAKQAASLAWPTCEGRVTRAYVESSRDRQGRTQYTPHLGYSYAVAGRNYDCDRIAWGGSSTGNWPKAADDTVARYPVGSAVKVHYNPENPSEAVLEPAQTAGLRVLLFIAIIFALVGSALLAFSRLIPSDVADVLNR